MPSEAPAEEGCAGMSGRQLGGSGNRPVWTTPQAAATPARAHPSGAAGRHSPGSPWSF